MITHHLATEEVNAYLRDLAERLRLLEAELPAFACPIGPSGDALLHQFFTVAPDLESRIETCRSNFDRIHKAVHFDEEVIPQLSGQNVLLLDGAVHSGSTMQAVLKAMEERGAKQVCSYGLILKRGSKFVPSMWGMVIDDYDRAYYLLDKIPNLRLQKFKAYCHLRLLGKDDLHSPRVKGGLKSLDDISWADRYFDMVNSDYSRRTYILAIGGKIVGYVTIRFKGATLVVDEIVVADSQQRSGCCSVLMRWAETSARQAQCDEMELWGIDNKVSTYEHYDFAVKEPRQEMDLDGEKYTFMRKRVVYHI